MWRWRKKLHQSSTTHCDCQTVKRILDSPFQDGMCWNSQYIKQPINKQNLIYFKYADELKWSGAFYTDLHSLVLCSIIAFQLILFSSFLRCGLEALHLPPHFSLCSPAFPSFSVQAAAFPAAASSGSKWGLAWLSWQEEEEASDWTLGVGTALKVMKPMRMATKETM